MAEFTSPEEIVRVVKGVRYSERMVISESETPSGYYPTLTAPAITVRVTGSKILSSVPPFSSGDSEEGLWPGMVTIRNVESETSSQEWQDIPQGQCLVDEINDRNLETGKRYKGTIIGYRNTKPVVVVQTSRPSAQDELLSCLWYVGLRTSGDCVKATIVSKTGSCSGVSMTDATLLTYDAGDARWESGATAFSGTGSGGTGQVTFDNSPSLVATVDGETGVYLGCDGQGGLMFGFGGAVLCGGSTVYCETANAFAMKFECTCCTSITGYTTPGWYCVQDTGPSDCTPVELMNEDRCDTSILICSGPYASEALAAAACEPVAESSFCYTTPTGPMASELPLGYNAIYQIDNNEAHFWFLRRTTGTVYINVRVTDNLGNPLGDCFPPVGDDRLLISPSSNMGIPSPTTCDFGLVISAADCMCVEADTEDAVLIVVNGRLGPIGFSPPWYYRITTANTPCAG